MGCNKMKTFNATKVTANSIELTTAEVLQDLYDIIDKEENFILSWSEGTVRQAEVMIANNLKAKVSTGDLKLTAKSGGK